MELKEKIYNDLTNIVVPKLTEGLNIAQNYGMDLGSRYIHYLIITDSLKIILMIIIFSITVILIKKGWIWSKDFNYEDKEPFRGFVIGFIGGFTLIVSVINLYITSLNLIKDLTIPEVRIYQEVQSQGLLK